MKLLAPVLRSAVAAAALLAVTAGAQAETFYRLESVSAPMTTAAPDWDYFALDTERDRLFIGRRGDGAAVWDMKANKLLKTLDNSKGANAIELVPEFDRGYVTTTDGFMVVFEISTLKTLDRVKLGEGGDAGFYDPVSKQVVFTMGDSKQVVFVDAKTAKVVSDIKMETDKLDGTAHDGKGNMYMALRYRHSLAKISAPERKMTGEIKLPGCEEPTGVAMDPANQRVFVGCRGKGQNPVLSVLDAASGTVVATVPIGRGNDGVVYDAATKRVYTINGIDGNIVIYNQVDANTYKLSQAVTTRPYARTMKFDERTKKIYTVAAEGYADGAKKINTNVAPFYPNTYYPDTFVLLTYAPK